MSRMRDVANGTVFGSLTVLREGIPTASRHKTVICQCTCGVQKVVRLANLTAGDTTSCGCQKSVSIRAKKVTHGMNGSYVYRVWQSMKARCYNETNASYSRYGGRGIVVCDRWRDNFEAFYADMGNPPSESHSIERSDSDGNYEPGNCRWATKVEQANNRRDTIYLTLNGRTASLATWAQEMGVPQSTIRMRLHRGWTHEEAISGKRRP